jgi:sterol 3beta-glucosyltransferase
VAFLEKHRNDRILLVTFGSMTNPEPEAKMRTILDILERNKIPAIINTASGGLVRPDTTTPEWLHFVSQIPYEWIFPKVYGVIHHGGSGTTHLALKYGCATMIIPHIVDQFVWNRIVSGLGAGPGGIKITNINTVNLEPKILDLVTNDSYKKKAEQIETQMEGEDFGEELYKAIVE